MLWTDLHFLNFPVLQHRCDLKGGSRREALENTLSATLRSSCQKKFLERQLPKLWHYYFASIVGHFAVWWPVVLGFLALQALFLELSKRHVGTCLNCVPAQAWPATRKIFTYHVRTLDNLGPIFQPTCIAFPTSWFE